MNERSGENYQRVFFVTVVSLMLLIMVTIYNIPIDKSGTGMGQDAQKQAAEAFSRTSESVRADRKDVKVRGIYVTGPVAGNRKRMDSLISLTESTAVNAMVIDVKNDSGEITYSMNYPDAKKIGAVKNYIGNMDSLVKELKSKHIYLIARVVAFKDPILAEKIPDLSLKNKDGTIFHDRQGLAWVNPYKKGVWNYILNVAIQAAKAGFDEIQFDYIRFSTDSGMKAVSFGGLEQKMTRQDVITEFTKYAYQILSKRGVCVSADVYGGIISNHKDGEIVGQNYERMAQYLDYISPMVYPSQYSEGAYGIERPDNKPYDLVYKVMNDSNRKLGEKDASVQNAQVRPWLQGFTAGWVKQNIPYTAQEIKAQIQAVYASGNDQWIIWNASNKYNNMGLNRTY